MNNIKTLLTTLNQAGVKLGLDEQQNLSVKGNKAALTPQLVAALKANKTAIVELLQQADISKSQAAKSQTIKAYERDGQGIPLSFAQQRLWLMTQMEEQAGQYHIFAALKLVGENNLDAVKGAFKALVERHESLRTVFKTGAEGEVSQHIQTDYAIDVPVQDISGVEAYKRHQMMIEACKAESEKAFDLAADLMIRPALLKVGDNEHVLMVTMHHIASDGWSMSVVVKEFSALYQQHIDGASKVSLPALDIQYADYAMWQRSEEQSQLFEQQLAFWQQQLADLPTVHNLPLDKPRPQVQQLKGQVLNSAVNGQLLAGLNRYCQHNGATLFMGLQSVFSVLMARYSNSEDVVMGTPIANREQPEVAGLIGFFVNNLVLRSDLLGNPSFTTLLQRNKKMLLDAYRHQQVPFDRVVEVLQPERNLSHSPLFQVMLVLQNNDKATLELPGLKLETLDVDSDDTMYDLTLTMAEGEEGLSLNWQYDSTVFNADTIGQMAEHFELLLTAMMQNPEKPVFELSMLSDAERQEQLIAFNADAGQADVSQCLHHLFEAQARNNPHATALVFEGQPMSYGELNDKANQLAGLLFEQHNVGPEKIVGICLERSTDMILAMLAVLKSGGAYLCLDPELPEQRLSHILEDANPAVVLVHEQMANKFEAMRNKLLVINDPGVTEAISRFNTENLDHLNEQLSGKHLAYTVYTSGSTGKPKGVMVEHGPVAAWIQSCSEIYRLSPDDRVLQFANINFDAAHEQIFTTLCSGASLYIRPSQHWDVETFYQYARDNQLTVAELPPAYCHEVLYDVEQSHSYFAKLNLKTLILGGEAVSPELVKLWQALPGECRLLNTYGPTETVIACTAYEFSKTSEQPVLIGKPTGKRSAYVLNQGSLVPKGVVGELHIGGDLLARGYLNLPELTAERFIENPFYDVNDASSHKRLYKTGDLAKWTTDGQLACFGRLDDQVKIRGFRVELGEIEAALAAETLVNRAVVVLNQNVEGGARQLVAYCVVGSDVLERAKDETCLQLQSSLSKQLPDYMVPEAIVLLARLPMTLNGKINYKALPQPERAIEPQFIAPQTDTERGLAESWQSLLAVEQVGRHDNFFNLGGHSLLATRLSTLIAQQFAVSLTMQQLFEAQTLSALAGVIDEQVLMLKLENGELDIDDLSEAQLDLYLASLEDEQG